MVEVFGAEQRQHRPEYFLGRDPGSNLRGERHRRADVPAALGYVVATVEHLALLARDYLIAAYPLPGIPIDERPDHRTELARVTDRDDGTGTHEPLDQLVEDRSHGHDARRGRAFLSGIGEGAGDDVGNGLIEIGVTV